MLFGLKLDGFIFVFSFFFRIIGLEIGIIVGEFIMVRWLCELLGKVIILLGFGGVIGWVIGVLIVVWLIVLVFNL